MNKSNELIANVINEVKKVVCGKDACVAKTFSAILAGGHILIEDVPGVGKTTLAVAFSRAMSLENRRMQFTPDVMPADIVGFNMYQKETGSFVYHPGTVMCNLFLADEINRTTPKTQSALLEVMEEGNVTVDGTTWEVPKPFVVIATQNPIGSAGTQLLPESQLDRFMICMSIGYPDIKSEIEIAKGRNINTSIELVQPVITAEELIELQQQAENVHVHDNVYMYISNLIRATRENPYISLGVSPRGTLACTRMAKAWALIAGRNYVLPQDVVDIFPDVATHRILMSKKHGAGIASADKVLRDIMVSVPQPTTFN